MAVLSVVNNLTGTLVDGSTVTAKQGLASADFNEGKDVTVTGYGFRLYEAIATASVRKLFDTAIDVPTAPLYFHFWADGTCYLQVIGATTSFTVKVVAGLPFVLVNNTFLAAGATTAIAGGSEPAVEAVAKLYVGNYSGASVSYGLTIVY